MSICFKSKVLQGVAVLHRVGRVCLGQFEDSGVFSGAVVLHVALANLGQVQKTVKKIGCPVEVGGAVGDSPAETTHALERTAKLVRQITNHGLVSGVRAAPVASPPCSKSVSCSRICRRDMRTGLTTVSVDVIATEQSARFVAIGNLAVPSERLACACIAKVLLVDCRRVTPAENVVASVLAEGDGLLQSLLEKGFLGGIAGSVDRVFGDHAGIPSSASGSYRSYSDSSSCILLAREERVRDSNRSSEKHKRGIGDHIDLGLMLCSLRR
jgi:hypothetical protein